eukprot:m51a1_g2173 hypothetical protein (834) ;mRNA; r:71437-75838
MDELEAVESRVEDALRSSRAHGTDLDDEISVLQARARQLRDQIALENAARAAALAESARLRGSACRVSLNRADGPAALEAQWELGSAITGAGRDASRDWVGVWPAGSRTSAAATSSASCVAWSRTRGEVRGSAKFSPLRPGLYVARLVIVQLEGWACESDPVLVGPEVHVTARVARDDANSARFPYKILVTWLQGESEGAEGRGGDEVRLVECSTGTRVSAAKVASSKATGVALDLPRSPGAYEVHYCYSGHVAHSGSAAVQVPCRDRMVVSRTMSEGVARVHWECPSVLVSRRGDHMALCRVGASGKEQPLRAHLLSAGCYFDAEASVGDVDFNLSKCLPNQAEQEQKQQYEFRLVVSSRTVMTTPLPCDLMSNPSAPESERSTDTGARAMTKENGYTCGCGDSFATSQLKAAHCKHCPTLQRRKTNASTGSPPPGASPRARGRSRASPAPRVDAGDGQRSESDDGFSDPAPSSPADTHASAPTAAGAPSAVPGRPPTPPALATPSGPLTAVGSVGGYACVCGAVLASSQLKAAHCKQCSAYRLRAQLPHKPGSAPLSLRELREAAVASAAQRELRESTREQTAASFTAAAQATAPKPPANKRPAPTATADSPPDRKKQLVGAPAPSHAPRTSSERRKGARGGGSEAPRRSASAVRQARRGGDSDHDDERAAQPLPPSPSRQRQQTSVQVEEIRTAAFDMVNALDNIEGTMRACEELRDGNPGVADVILERLRYARADLLSRASAHGVARVAVQVGAKVDTALHAREFEMPTANPEEMPPGTVAQVLLPAYTFRGSVLRPAHVVTYAAPVGLSSASSDASPTGDESPAVDSL